MIYSLTEPAIELVPVIAQLGAWGRRHLPASRELSIRAELLEEGDPELWEEFMAELREQHLGITRPSGSESVLDRLGAVQQLEDPQQLDGKKTTWSSRVLNSICGSDGSASVSVRRIILLGADRRDACAGNRGADAGEGGCLWHLRQRCAHG